MAKKVLLVDDDKNIIKYLSVVLSENGYEPVTALDGNEGLQKVKEFKPDLIVLDVMMPKKSGFVLFNQIKKLPECKDVPIIMLTGVSGVLEEIDKDEQNSDVRTMDSLKDTLRQHIKKMREEGKVKPEMFLDKPVDHDVFISKVRELIG